MARLKAIKKVPEDITPEQTKVLNIIRDMKKFFKTPDEQLKIRGKSNEGSKQFNWRYLRYDIDNIIICFENFAASYAGKSEVDTYRLIIGSYFKAKPGK